MAKLMTFCGKRFAVNVLRIILQLIYCCRCFNVLVFIDYLL